MADATNKVASVIGFFSTASVYGEVDSDDVFPSVTKQKDCEENVDSENYEWTDATPCEMVAKSLNGKLEGSIDFAIECVGFKASDGESFRIGHAGELNNTQCLRLKTRTGDGIDECNIVADTLNKKLFSENTDSPSFDVTSCLHSTYGHFLQVQQSRHVSECDTTAHRLISLVADEVLENGYEAFYLRLLLGCLVGMCCFCSVLQQEKCCCKCWPGCFGGKKFGTFLKGPRIEQRESPAVVVRALREYKPSASMAHNQLAMAQYEEFTLIGVDKNTSLCCWSSLGTSLTRFWTVERAVRANSETSGEHSKMEGSVPSNYVEKIPVPLDDTFAPVEMSWARPKCCGPGRKFTLTVRHPRWGILGWTLLYGWSAYDLATDWGMYRITLAIEPQHQKLRNACFHFCVLSTLLFAIQTYSTVFIVQIWFGFRSDQEDPCCCRGLTSHWQWAKILKGLPMLSVVIEDIPQLVITAMYMTSVHKNDLRKNDTLPILSLISSVPLVVWTIYSFYGLWSAQPSGRPESREIIFNPAFKFVNGTTGDALPKAVDDNIPAGEIITFDADAMRTAHNDASGESTHGSASAAKHLAATTAELPAGADDDGADDDDSSHAYHLAAATGPEPDELTTQV